MIKAKALKPGDTIGIIAPASPTARQNVYLSKKALEEMGFKVKIGESCYETYGYLAGKDELRAKDLNDMFRDKKVDGVICLRGGYGTLRILNMIDYEVIRKNPKVFVGYSDITAVHVALNQRCELVTFHGPMTASNMIGGFNKYSYKSLFKAVGSTEVVGELRNPGGEKVKVINKGTAEGKIIGGNLTLITSTLGTKFEIDTKGKILFLEEIEEKPYKIDRMLTELLLAGKLQQVNGIVLGDWKDCKADKGERSLSLMKVFEEIIKPLGIPIIYNVKSGHCSPMMTLPMGVKAKINGNTGKLEIEESAVM